MELGIPNATPLGVTQKANTGYAAVLDQSSFDPIKFLENMNTEMEAKETAKAKQQLERKAKWNNYKLPDINELNWANQEDLTKAIEEISNVAAEAAASGIDPDGIEYQKAIMPYMQRIAKAKKEGDDLYKFSEDLFNSQGEYDPEDVKKWYEGLKAQPNLAARIEYKDNNPLPQKPFDIQNAIVKLMPAADVKDKMLGGGVIGQTGKLNRDKVRTFVDGQFKKFTLDPTTADDMTRTYEAGLKAGYWKDADGFLEHMTDEVMAKGNETYNITGYSSSSFGGDREKSKVGLSPIYDEGFTPTSSSGKSQRIKELEAKYQNAVDTNTNFLTDAENQELIRLKKEMGNVKATRPLKGLDVTDWKTGDVKVINVISEDNRDIAFVPLRYYRTRGADGSEFWRVEGKEGQSKSIIKAEEKSDYSGQDVEFIDIGNGEYQVISLNTNPISIPLSPANKSRLNTHFGIDFDSEVKKYEKDAPKSASSSAPSISMDDYRAMSLSERQAYIAKGGKVPTK